MTYTPFTRARQLVPRWHAFSSALATGELAVPKNVFRPTEISSELRDRLVQWRTNPNVITAAEVVETAIVEGIEQEAVKPATSLLATNSVATDLVKRQAELLLQRTGHSTEAAPIRQAATIANARIRTRAFPHDAFAWTDLSRAYLGAGKDKNAKRAIQVALQLAPHNRHVLRSAARLFLHLGNPDEAHDLLSRNSASPHDPWLMAGEVALSALAGRKPRFFKTGTALIESSGLLPRHLSELASAIGTVNLIDGNRRARKLFGTSLIDPTGNSLAQAEWATPHIGNLVRPIALDRIPDNAEARVFKAYWAKDFSTIMQACVAWHAEEPFSSRPFDLGSVAAITIEEHEAARQFAEDGLRLNPNSSGLANNLAYALISLTRYTEASQIIEAQLSKLKEAALGPMTATAGMLAMRLGDHEASIRLYRNAISIFKRLQNVPGEAVALAYFAKEAARAELSMAGAILGEAKQFLKKIPSVPEADIVLERAQTWIAAAEHRKQVRLPNS